MTWKSPTNWATNDELSSNELNREPFSDNLSKSVAYLIVSNKEDSSDCSMSIPLGIAGSLEHAKLLIEGEFRLIARPSVISMEWIEDDFSGYQTYSLEYTFSFKRTVPTTTVLPNGMIIAQGSHLEETTQTAFCDFVIKVVPIVKGWGMQAEIQELGS